ncbi:MAG: TOMM precursor leader peptide-binding protein [Streptosporangiaceae bacterium]|nr:TOMM precursor leader peptide-binding protein [Streptosporangiaceae bacterium]
MEPADSRLVSFKTHLRVATIPAEAVCLVSERQVTALTGSSIERLAPLLDGTRTVAQVKRELSASLTAAEVENMLARLSDAGLISYFRTEEAAPGDGGRAYWSLAGIEPGNAASALASSPIEIITTGSADASAVADACRSSGLILREADGDTAVFSLVICEDFLDPALAGINAGQLASRRPWLLAKPSGAVAWIGPVFQPGTGPCWACLAKRLAGNRLGGFLSQEGAGNGKSNGNSGPRLPRSASLPASLSAGLHIAVLEAAKWLAGIRYDGQLCVYVLDTLTLRGDHHEVARRPQCASCGDPGLVAVQTSKPVTLVPRPILEAANAGNGQRVLPLPTVLEMYGHLVDPVTGIVGEVRRDPRCPDFLHAYLSGRNRAMTESSIGALRAGLRSQSGGKGVTELEARVAALCEAVERYSATLDGDELTIRDSYRGLGDKAVHPGTCQLFHERQYADRARWNATCAPFHRVPEPFDERAVTNWTPAWSLLSHEHKLLPTAMVYFNPDPGRTPVSVRSDSNGSAAGGSLEDAILQGFFELVERDAVALWWYNRTYQRGVILDSFDDPWISALPGMYRRLNRQLWVLDVTSDLGIPAMAAISRRTDKPAEDIMSGFGAHFDPHIALRRALTELGQLMWAVADVRADGMGYAVDDPHLLSWWSSATVHNQRYLLPDHAQAPATPDDYGYQPGQYLDLDRMCAVARGAGLDILVLNQTRPDIKMPVVKVVVPGLRHFWPRFAPGRLYDVPVRLGRVDEQTSYENLNPIPVYL